MKDLEFCVPCLFGLEGLVGDELRRMGMEDVRVEDRRVFFTGGAAELARANIGLRMGERVMILLARFPARSFEELYQGVKAIPLERFVPREGAFPVKGYSLDSQLHSVPDCQSIVKKAAVDHLGAHYGLTWLPETGETYQLRFSIMKDLCEVFLDSSGVSLHKRGYRAVGVEAPLRETLAAAMAQLLPEHRAVLQLRVVNEMSYEQIADVLDIQIGTVKSRLSRARNQLKKILERGNLSRRASSESMEGEVAAK